MNVHRRCRLKLCTKVKVIHYPSAAMSARRTSKFRIVVSGIQDFMVAVVTGREEKAMV